LSVTGLRVWRQFVHCYLWACNISCDQQHNEHHGSTQAGGDQGEECKAWTVFWHFKLLTDNSAQGQWLPGSVRQAIRQKLLSQRALPFARSGG
jgi:hypothetical protein